MTTWISLNRWAAQQKLSAPQLLSSQPRTYSVNSPNGIMILAVGSHEANWNGVELLLGFPPEFIDGQLFVHSLDLQKNLQPLLCAPPLLFNSNRVIVIDPGHGGGNTGTKSVLDGRFEKEFTLDWAERLKPLLEKEGWTVFLTRTNDSEISLPERIAFAEAHHADVFISLHFNTAAPDTQQAGLETYCLTPTGMPSSLTRGYDDTVSQNFPDNHYDEQNLQLAMRLQSALLHASGEKDRGVRRARFMGVLSNQHQPAILIEGGYLSNPHEAEKIESAAHRQKLAEAVADALK
jgi:N-acetylmuramoyl-L-alanine amidase